MQVNNNSIFGYFYNKSDFIIRFLYSRIPFISNFLFWKLYSSNFKTLDQKFEEMKKQLELNNFDFNNKICLELGPGNSYINAYNLLMNGARKVILVDKYPRNPQTRKQKDYFNKELNYIKNKYNQKTLFFIKNGKINTKYLEFLSNEITNIKFEENVDLIYSMSVFEHIKDIGNNINKLGRILKGNGLMYHIIDMRDHYNFNKPFLFYKYSEKTWDKYLTKEGKSYTNRLRYDDFIKLFKKNNITIIQEYLNKYSIKDDQKLSDKFMEKSQDNLCIGIAKFILKKS